MLYILLLQQRNKITGQVINTGIGAYINAYAEHHDLK